MKKAVDAKCYEDGKSIQTIKVELIGVVFAFPARLPARLNELDVAVLEDSQDACRRMPQANMRNASICLRMH